MILGILHHSSISLWGRRLKFILKWNNNWLTELSPVLPCWKFLNNTQQYHIACPLAVSLVSFKFRLCSPQVISVKQVILWYTEQCYNGTWLCKYFPAIALTLNVRGPSYLGLTRSISWLLMPWLLTSPGHQQPWYWLCRLGRFLSFLRKDLNYLRCINVEKWHKM